MSASTDINAILQTAADGHYYHEVDSNGKFKGRAVIGGAEQRWKTQPDYVYVPDYRICGKLEAVEAVAQKMKIKKLDFIGVDDIKSAEYLDELAAYREFKKKEKESKPVVDDEKFDAFVAGLSHFKINKEEAKPTRYGAKEPALRYEHLGAGKVLDVSNRRENGTGSVVVEAASMSKNRIRGPLSIKVVSSNLDTYADELHSIGKWSEDEIDAALEKWQSNKEAHDRSTKKAVVLGAGIKPVTVRK